MKRIRFIEVDGEFVKKEEPIFSFCDCISGKLQVVPTVRDEENLHTCEFCESYVVWTTPEEISNNGRR
jgi:hypothetical protein